jgi:hypothetical protein
MRAYFFNMIAMNALAALRALPPLSSVLIGHGPYLLAFHLILDAFFEFLKNYFFSPRTRPPEWNTWT